MAMAVKFSQFIQFQPKQMEAVRQLGRKRFIYYGGARGGGKTYCAIGVAALVAEQFPGVKIAFMRRTIEELKSQIIPKFLQLFPAGELYTWRPSDKLIRWHNGSTIHFRPLNDLEDATKEQGIERHMYIIDEANLVHEDLLLILRGSLRNADIPGWRTTMFMTGNPGGVSDLYFKTRFVRPDYSRWTEAELIDRHEYAFIQAKIYDNPRLLENDPGYLDMLRAQPEHRRRAWLDGDWDVFSGQFFEMWDERVHVVEDFDIPRDWARWRSVDLGKGSHPTVALWWAQRPNDGTPEAGTVYCYRELAVYTAPEVAAQQIVERSMPGESFIMTFADPNIWARDNDVWDNEQFFRRAGIILTRSSNKRSVGWATLKQWLHWEGDISSGIIRQLPRMRVFRSCIGIRESLPTLQYVGNGREDCDSRQMDDWADAMRYFVMGVQYGWIYNAAGQHVGEFGRHEPVELVDVLYRVDEASLSAHVHDHELLPNERSLWDYDDEVVARYDIAYADFDEL